MLPHPFSSQRFSSGCPDSAVPHDVPSIYPRTSNSLIFFVTFINIRPCCTCIAQSSTSRSQILQRTLRYRKSPNGKTCYLCASGEFCFFSSFLLFVLGVLVDCVVDGAEKGGVACVSTSTHGARAHTFRHLNYWPSIPNLMERLFGIGVHAALSDDHWR